MGGLERASTHSISEIGGAEAAEPASAVRPLMTVSRLLSSGSGCVWRSDRPSLPVPASTCGGMARSRLGGEGCASGAKHSECTCLVALFLRFASAEGWGCAVRCSGCSSLGHRAAGGDVNRRNDVNRRTIEKQRQTRRLQAAHPPVGSVIRKQSAPVQRRRVVMAVALERRGRGAGGVRE